jgi:AraC family transcriptional activator of pobA
VKAGVQIPRHDLRNANGQKVSFEFQEWTDTGMYNTQHLHRHNFNEILVFTKGTARHDIDFATHEATAGSVHFVASENVHMLVRDADTTGYTFMFTDDLLSPELAERLPFLQVLPVVTLDAGQLAVVNSMAAIIKQEYEARGDMYEQVIRAQMQALLTYLLRIYNAGPGAVQEAMPQHIVAFRQLLKKHYKEHLSIERYAARLNISVKHLIDVCRKHTGKTPLQHVKEHMVTEAKRLLYNTAMSVKEIAYELNFDEPANFSKYFKAVTGYTPIDYRNAGK